MSDERFITAETATKRLKVSRQTLYAYVSRGLIRSINPETEGQDPRRKLYMSEDVDRLVDRKAHGRKPARIAAGTLNWGLPVLESELTLIDQEKLYYRGKDAVALAETNTLEDTACLLWGASDTAPFDDPLPVGLVYANPVEGGPIGRWSVIARSTAALARLNNEDMPIRRVHADVLHRKGAFLVRALTSAICEQTVKTVPVHEQLADAWGIDHMYADYLRRTLVLLADHELNASTFTVRVVASTGASLSACLLGGLSALSGPLHGSASDQVRVLFDQIDQTGDPERVIDSRLRRGERLPGVGHTLYPSGDPRAGAIIKEIDLTQHEEQTLSIIFEKTGHRENVDMALVLMERHLKLPNEAAIALFAIGRSAGWIAHALEQNRTGQLIRPRAQYTGPSPGLTVNS